MNSFISSLPSLFKNNSEDSILKIEKHDDRYSSSVCDQTDFSTTITTMICFKEIFDVEVLKRICCRPLIDIDVTKIDENSLLLTKGVLRKIFIGFLDFQTADLSEELPVTAIDIQFRRRIPFDTFEGVEPFFMGNSPPLHLFTFDKAQTSGKGLEGLIERIFIRMHHHFMVINESDRKAAELRDIELLTSRLADREMQPGEIIHLSDGYFYVDQVFIGGGAYVSVLKDLEELNSPKLICRGTAMRRTATEGFKSGVNDVLLEIGSMGVEAVWPELFTYLKRSGIDSIEVLGKSLGGAYAQELAILIEAINEIKVEKLTTVCSVGVGEAINELFKNEVLVKRTTPFEIQVIRNGGETQDQVDYIPSIGGVHLGEGAPIDRCRIEVCYIQPGQGEVGFLSNNLSWYHLSGNFLFSFSKGHCRQTTLERFSWKYVEADQINDHLRIGVQLETIRKSLAYFIHFFSFFLINPKPFASILNRGRGERESFTEKENLELVNET